MDGAGRDAIRDLLAGLGESQTRLARSVLAARVEWTTRSTSRTALAHGHGHAQTRSATGEEACWSQSIAIPIANKPRRAHPNQCDC
jgi:hypothetical protein